MAGNPEDGAQEDPPSDGFLLSIQPEHGGTQLWLRDDETGDPELVITFVLLCAGEFALTGRWGFEMGPHMTDAGWHFYDRGKTTAEIVLDLYRAIRRGAGDAVLLGCNTIGHLAAGLVEAQRIGDDTSGQHWERTRRMGINTLAHRLPQNRTFFAIDPDCVGITPDIPWTLNRQWLDLIARSGAVLFVSADPNSTGPEQQTALREAFQIAASGQSTATPSDGLTSTTPIHWDFHSAKATTHRDYDWTSPDGADPYPI